MKARVFLAALTASFGSYASQVEIPSALLCTYTSGFYVSHKGASTKPTSVPFTRIRELRLAGLSRPRRGLQLTDDLAKSKYDPSELFKNQGFDSVAKALVYDQDMDPEGRFRKTKEHWLASLVMTDDAAFVPDLRVVTLDARYGPQGMMQIISTTLMDNGTYEAMLFDPQSSSAGSWFVNVLFGSCKKE